MKKYVLLIILITILMSSCEQTANEVILTAEPVDSVSATSSALLAGLANKKATQDASDAAQGVDLSALDNYESYEFKWWNETVFYEIFVRSFADSDGDGIGDFNGLTAKLDYLNDGDPETDDDLGITGIWLMPIMPSPSYHGYDVTNYQGINPDYGTMDDFKNFLDEAHARGIKVIIDFVVNHTSSQHPYFELSTNPNSYYRDWYRWEETPPNQIGTWGQGVWHEHVASGNSYFGMFWDGMPDLNYETPAVTEMMYDHTKFWLNHIGVDGLRIDAARYLIENGNQMADTDATHAWFADFYEFYKGEQPDAMTVLEVWSSSFESAGYVVDDEADLTFDFNQAEQVMSGVNNRNVHTINAGLVRSTELYPSFQYATFLTNHDMDRVMSNFVGDVQKAKFAATVLLTSPGVPFIYYGEEIGMDGAGPHENIRTPMHWNDSNGAGFTEGVPWEAINDDYDVLNVANLSTDEESLLNLYRDLIHLRAEHAALSIGELFLLDSDHKNVFGMLRVLEDEAFLVTFNMANQEIGDYQFSVDVSRLMGEYEADLVYGDEASDTFDVVITNENGGFIYKPTKTMLPYQISIYQLTTIK